MPYVRKIISSTSMLILTLCLALSACSRGVDVNGISTQAAQTVIAEVTHNAPSPTASPPPASATLTQTPTATATPLPSATPTPAASATPQPSATPLPPPATLSPDEAILYYLVTKGDGGPVGCGDTAVWINTGRQRSGNVEQDVKTALQSLFGNHFQNYGSLYNSLYASSINVDSVTYFPGEEKISIRLSGRYARSDDRCDNSRARAQVWSTIRQFGGIKTIDILLNGNLLGDILSNT